MQNPKNLLVTEKALALAVTVYPVTVDFGREERYGLTSQLRRAAVSIGSNIAEGCGRSGDRELTAFLHVAMGSASELEVQVEIARRLGLSSPARLDSVTEQGSEVKRMLSRLIVGIKSKPSNNSDAGASPSKPPPR